MSNINIKCRDCGAPIDPHYNELTNVRMTYFSRCFTCDHWSKYVYLADDQNSLRIDGTQFFLGEEDDKSIDRGYEGRKFEIALFPIPGRNSEWKFETTNLWLVGKIPERFRKMLPDNARFVKEWIIG